MDRVNPAGNQYWKPRFACRVRGCVREATHAGFHTTNPNIAHREDRSGESATPDSLLRSELREKERRRKEREEREAQE